MKTCSDSAVNGNFGAGYETGIATCEKERRLADLQRRSNAAKGMVSFKIC